MMTRDEALRQALARAAGGLDWGYPCLIWVADYLRDATGTDPAADWRGVAWDEARARAALRRAARGGHGDTLVARAIDAVARRDGWEEVTDQRQGAVMIGLYLAAADDEALLVGDAAIGVPAIFDGRDRWLVSVDGRGVTSLGERPVRMWVVG